MIIQRGCILEAFDWCVYPLAPVLVANLGTVSPCLTVSLEFTKTPVKINTTADPIHDYEAMNIASNAWKTDKNNGIDVKQFV